MEERMKFVARLRAGERITDLCREFEISRKTAYKFVARYEEHGPLGLIDQRRVPERIPHRTSAEVITLIVKLRQKHPTWGPKKLHDVLSRKHADVRLPSISTIGDILVRKGLIVRKRRRKHHVPAEYATLSTPTAPNDLWCIDFKGQFRLGNGRYCYPLTVTDAATRYVLACEGFESIDGREVRCVLEQLFKTLGVPKAIRFDGGAPFASKGLMRLSRLSAWWVSLGIKLEQIEPASPQQNGRHERMHRTLKAETTRPPSQTLLQQQERFEKWLAVFNHERPHEALAMKRPADLYVASTRPYAPKPAEYPLHDLVRRVASNGTLQFGSKQRPEGYFLSESIAGHELGLRELEDGRWLVSLHRLDLGIIDRVARTFTAASQAIETPTKTNEGSKPRPQKRAAHRPSRTAA
jgi:transposase InsO family protein